MNRCLQNTTTLLAFLFVTFTTLIGQELLINELVPSNSTLLDEYSEASDWIEIYNNGSTTIDLNGLGLSDKLDFTNTWKFGEVSIEPGKHLLVFASGRNKSELSSYETLIDHGDAWKYLVPNREISTEWRDISFDDSAWNSGNSGFGYGDGDDATTFSSGTRSVFIRKEFNISDISKITDVLLHMDYDDGFVAHINGIEVARANVGQVGDEPPYNSGTSTDHEAVIYNGGSPDLFNVSDILSSLVQGKNVLTVQGYNTNGNSSDLTLIPFLTVGKSSGASGNVPSILGIPGGKLHADFKLSSEGESVYLFSDIGSILDSINYGEFPSDISYGRQTDGSNSLVLFSSPTPESSNGGNFYTGLSDTPIVFSHATGIYNSNISLSLSGSQYIRFTRDGSEPNETSTLYSAPFTVSLNTVVKAKIYEPGLLPTVTYKGNYLFNASFHSLPIITLNTEDKYLFDGQTGMYAYGSNYENQVPYRGANFWEDWEYPFEINYYNENKDLVIDVQAGAKIFGGWSRANDQRSFALFARASYGSKNFNYKIFKTRPYSKFEALVLRNSGNDWDRSFMRDGIMTGLMKGSNVDYQAYQPAVTYLNGEYWGMYNIREKVNEHLLASLHNVDPDKLDLIEANGGLIHGSNIDYLNLRTFIENNSLVNTSNFEYVESQIDFDNFMEYYAAQIYYNNTDWPGNNIKYWKAENGKWRWIMYDTDFGIGVYGNMDYTENTLDFALESNGPNWPNPPWSTLFFRKLIENTQFRNRFANRFADMINSRYVPQNTHTHIDTTAALIDDEIARHRNRWNHDYGFWVEQIQVMKNFFSLRPNLMREFIRQRFGYPNRHTITVKIEGVDNGSVRLNSLLLNEEEWSGQYFQGNPINLTAVPKPGYKFDRWTGSSTSTNANLEINLTGQSRVTAHFVPAEISFPIVINEINYNSPDDPNSGDWIELHNYSDQNVDISSWIFKDGNDDHSYVIPQNTVMGPKEFLVLTQDFAKFVEVNPSIDNFIGNFDFGLSGDGEVLRLYNGEGVFQDSVHYLSVLPWPEEANNLGPTLELISPELDNVLAENWKSYIKHNGTPGAPNRTPTGVEEVLNIQVASVFPNPAADMINISIDDFGLSIQSIKVFDLQGRMQLWKKGFGAVSTIDLDVSLIAQGHYIGQVTLSDGSNHNVKFTKM